MPARKMRPRYFSSIENVQFLFFSLTCTSYMSIAFIDFVSELNIFLFKILGAGIDSPPLSEEDRIGNKEKKQKNQLYTWIKNECRRGMFTSNYGTM